MNLTSYYLGTPVPDPLILYLIYKYLHLYPGRNQVKTVLGCTRFHLQYVILPALHYLCLVMDEIHWNDRLDPRNHTPHFPFLFTGIVDTFPIRVKQPVNKELRESLYNPKYGACVYKCQLGIDFLGMVLILCYH